MNLGNSPSPCSPSLSSVLQDHQPWAQYDFEGRMKGFSVYNIYFQLHSVSGINFTQGKEILHESFIG